MTNIEYPVDYYALPIPVSESGEWVYLDEFKKQKGFGVFECDKCKKAWISAHAFKKYKQQCSRCKKYRTPLYLWSNDYTESTYKVKTRNPTKIPHKCELCEPCIKKTGECCCYEETPPIPKIIKVENKAPMLLNREYMQYIKPQTIQRETTLTSGVFDKYEDDLYYSKPYYPQIKQISPVNERSISDNTNDSQVSKYDIKKNSFGCILF